MLQLFDDACRHDQPRWTALGPIRVTAESQAIKLRIDRRTISTAWNAFQLLLPVAFNVRVIVEQPRPSACSDLRKVIKEHAHIVVARSAWTYECFDVELRFKLWNAVDAFLVVIINA